MTQVTRTPKRAALYLRQSLDRDGTGLAIDRQRDQCREYAESLGWTITSEYVDNDVSASKGRRPAYEQMLTDVEAGRLDGIVAWHLDRLHRQPAELESFIDRTHGVALATVSGDVDLSTSMGRLVARLLGNVARHEIEHKSERQKAAGMQAASMGKPPTGRRAFGYSPDGTVPVPGEAEMIRDAYTALLAGDSLRAIVRRWNDAGSRTDKGNVWRPDSVRDCLLRARNAGLRQYHGVTVTEGTWEAIVSEDTWRATVSVLTDPARRTTPDTRRKYLLSGLARCGVCHGKVITARSSTGRRTYRCPDRKHISVSAQPIDDYVTRATRVRLSGTDSVPRDDSPEDDDGRGLRQEAVTLAARLDEANAMFASGGMDGGSYVKVTATIRDRAAEVDRLRDAASRSTVLSRVTRADALEDWDDLDIDRQRSVIDALMTVELHSPGRGAKTFRPDCVGITFR